MSKSRINTQELNNTLSDCELSNEISAFITAANHNDTIKNNPLSIEFITLLNYANTNKGIFSNEELRLLTEVIRATIKKIEQPDNKEINAKYNELMEKLFKTAEIKANQRWSGPAHFFGKVAICVAGIVSVFLVAGFIILGALVPGCSVHPSDILKTAKYFTRLFNEFSSHRKNEDAYAKLHTQAKKIKMKGIPRSFFSKYTATAPTEASNTTQEKDKSLTCKKRA